MPKVYNAIKIRPEWKNASNTRSDNGWEKATSIDDLEDPWHQYPSKSPVTFRAMHDEKYLYVRFDVIKKDIKVFKSTGAKEEVIFSDRVELFLRTDNTMREYYCLEIDPQGRVLDYSAAYYRQFKYSWQWLPNHLFARGVATNRGYRVDATISKASLKELDLLRNDRMEVGVFQADCLQLAANNPESSVFSWSSWVDPQTPHPDFHVPTAFGELYLQS